MSGHYLRRRLFQSALTIFVIVAFNFVLFRVIPGDPARLLLGPRMQQLNPEVLVNLRARMGIDQPIFPDQFVTYLGNLVTGDLGYSFKYSGRLVTDVIGERIGPTLLLVGLGLLIGTMLGIILGAIAGWNRGRPVDVVGINGSLLASAIPGFWLGMILIVIFATTLHWLPTGGMLTPGASYPDTWAYLVDLGRHLVLPVTVIVIADIGGMALIMRNSLIETTGEDYITTARAKGVSSRGILWHHALPNALLPIVTIVALSFGFLIGGAVTIETVFSWPGLGLLSVEALGNRDYPVMQALFLMITISVVLANLFADILYAVLDPRVRIS